MHWIPRPRAGSLANSTKRYIALIMRVIADGLMTRLFRELAASQTSGPPDTWPAPIVGLFSFRAASIIKR